MPRTTAQLTDVLDAAIAYGRRRRPVFPVGLDKRPLTAHGFKDATTDERTIRRWWSQHRHAGIATPTGPNWFVLDDDTNGEAIAQLEAEHEPLPPTVEVVTPRPGLHLYLLGSVTNSDSALPDGLNVRGIGGYVVLPPSDGYEWRVAPDEIPIAPAPTWLLGLLASPSNGTGCGDQRPPVERVPHGQRHPYLADFTVRLLRGGITDQRRIAAHLRTEFELSCEPLPVPTPGYFEAWAQWATSTRMADRERACAELADFIRARRQEVR
jgi:Bifunctional DNA primase/polymerase, N-terminal